MLRHPMKWIGCWWSCLLLCSLVSADEPAATAPHKEIGKLEWQVDYSEAYRLARRDHKQMLIFFRDESDLLTAGKFERDVLASPELDPVLEKFVRVVLPLTAPCPALPPMETSAAGEAKKMDPMAATDPATMAVAEAAQQPKAPGTLLECSAFAHMRKQPGLCIIDLTDSELPWYGRVVSVVPFDEEQHTAASLKVILELPKGSLSQRTLIYVLRTHPEVPQSVWSTAHPFLLEQCRVHSQMMANYESVGHYDWGNRSAVIGQQFGYSPMEVASVGAGRSILEAARSAVATWRGSGVHWGMIAAPGSHFGYDMIQAPSGNWYATGIFVP